MQGGITRPLSPLSQPCIPRRAFILALKTRDRRPNTPSPGEPTCIQRRTADAAGQTLRRAYAALITALPKPSPSPAPAPPVSSASAASAFVSLPSLLFLLLLHLLLFPLMLLVFLFSFLLSYDCIQVSHHCPTLYCFRHFCSALVPLPTVV